LPIYTNIGGDMNNGNIAVGLPSEYYTERELSHRWKLDPKTLRNWRCQGRGPRFIKIGVNVRYPASEILRHENIPCSGVEV
tara:strand:- start:16 stop:258 length:243 start_codon:yes stop_codon:yes gene_type:complete